MDVTELVRQAGPVELPRLARGVIYGGVSHPQAAPSSFAEAVWVILPQGSSEHLYGPCKWLAGHGTAKPQPGAECVIGFDELDKPVIVWWDGSQSEPVPAAESVTEAMLAAAVKAKLADSGWIEVAGSFLNSWTNLGAPFLLVAYRKQGNVVRLRGSLQSGASGKTAFVLPASYRPTARTINAAGTGFGSGTALVEVSANGEVIPFWTAGSEVGLDGVTFTVD